MGTSFSCFCWSFTSHGDDFIHLENASHSANGDLTFIRNRHQCLFLQSCQCFYCFSSFRTRSTWCTSLVTRWVRGPYIGPCTTCWPCYHYWLYHHLSICPFIKYDAPRGRTCIYGRCIPCFPTIWSALNCCINYWCSCCS